MTTARQLAVETLLQLETTGRHLDSVSESVLRKAALSAQDRRFFKELTAGTVRMRNAVDYAIDHFSKTRLKDLPHITRAVLRLGGYQLLYMRSIPERAVVHEMVEVAQALSHRGTGGYVNAVLRSFSTERDNLEWPSSLGDPVAYITITASYPRWLAERWIQQFGALEAMELANAMNERPIAAARHNPLRISWDSLEAELRIDQLWDGESSWIPDAFRATNHQALVEHRGLLEGWYYIQSESSCLPPHAGALEPGLRVLDMCSAPGGKTAHMAALMNNKGEIIALDQNPRRLRRLNENMKRMGVKIVQAQTTDASQYNAEPFDRVFLDAPCSGLGTLGHKPDIRWQKTPEQINSLVGIQKRLLDQAAALTKVGGTLIYSTCTTEHCENEGQIRWFLEKHPEYELGTLPPWSCSSPDLGMFQVLPHTHHSDGFFTAVLKRRR